MTRSSRSAAAAVLALLLTNGSAGAAPSPADVESARSLYVLGKELRDQGNLAGSLEHFKAAHALVPTPITALELARAHALVGQPLEARAILLGIERMAVAPDESKKATASRAEARTFAEDLARLIPALDIRVSRAPGADAEVTIDGERVPVEALAVPRKVNPGKHVVVARVGALEKTEDVSVPEREVRIVSFDLRGAVPTARPVEHVEEQTRGPWLAVSLGVAGVASAVSLGAGAYALSKKGSLDDVCVAGRCPPVAHDDLSDLRTWSTVSTVAFGVAVVAVGTSVVLWLTQRDGKARTASAVPVVVRW